MSLFVQSRESSLWNTVGIYATAPLAATMAFPFTFPLFLLKSAQQQERPWPKLPFATLARESLKGSLAVGTVVGVQMAVQKTLEKYVMEATNKTELPPNVLLPISFTAAVVSTPCLAVVNGVTLRHPIRKSLREMNRTQFFAILIRETGFLAALRLAEPISEKLKNCYGKNHFVEYGTKIGIAMLTSIVVNGADVVLTRTQAKMVVRPVDCMRGAPVRAAAVGLFSGLYSLFEKSLHPIQKDTSHVSI